MILMALSIFISPVNRHCEWAHILKSNFSSDWIDVAKAPLANFTMTIKQLF